MTEGTDRHELTEEQAALLVGVLRRDMVGLLDRGEIPFETVGEHRRLRTEDVLAHREGRSRRRREQLDELSRLAQEFEGAYR